MKTLSLIVLICINQIANSQDVHKNSAAISLSKLSDKFIYIFCRGTRSKAGIIANKYNKQDKNISHIGIGYVENGNVCIFNVNDITDHTRSALFVDSIQSFIAVTDAFYFGIWQYHSTAKELEMLKRVCREYGHRKITFDYRFNIADNDTLYCSEFVCQVLTKVLPRISFEPSTVPLDNKLYETILKRTALIYYPVDFFMKSNLFTKVIETNL